MSLNVFVLHKEQNKRNSLKFSHNSRRAIIRFAQSRLSKCSLSSSGEIRKHNQTSQSLLVKLERMSLLGSGMALRQQRDKLCLLTVQESMDKKKNAYQGCDSSLISVGVCIYVCVLLTGQFWFISKSGCCVQSIVSRISTCIPPLVSV